MSLEQLKKEGWFDRTPVDLELGPAEIAALRNGATLTCAQGGRRYTIRLRESWVEPIEARFVIIEESLPRRD